MILEIIRFSVCAIVALATVAAVGYGRYRALEVRNQKAIPWERDVAQCPICRNEIYDHQEKRKLVCHHAFHKECLACVFEGTATNRRTCPFCRQNVSETVVSSIL